MTSDSIQASENGARKSRVMGSTNDLAMETPTSLSSPPDRFLKWLPASCPASRTCSGSWDSAGLTGSGTRGSWPAGTEPSHPGEAGRLPVQNVRMRNVQAGTWWTMPSGAGG
jgi:hypothetical protein